MTDYVIPDSKALREILAVVYGDDLAVTADAAPDLTGRYAATYINDEDRLVVVAACDEAFVAYAGGALTMLPKDVVDEMLSSKSLSDVVVANFHEVMNICSRLLIAEHGAHLRLDQSLDPASGAAPVSALQADAQIASFNIEIPNYGSGAISFLVT